MKTGRNDLCPCGCGRKAKKCDGMGRVRLALAAKLRAALGYVLRALAG